MFGKGICFSSYFILKYFNIEVISLIGDSNTENLIGQTANQIQLKCCKIIELELQRLQRDGMGHDSP